ncbi:MAG: SDR family oxidoreductase [Desulfobacteraceae bacterium]|nr:SDR family oxidoreductase [Desulfobacteraceae bacterium]
MKILSFEGKNIYIFGGSSGIGLAAGLQLAGLGANLFIHARNKAGLQAAATQIKQQRRVNTQRVAWMSVDIADHLEVNKAINTSVETYGPPDILINCAGRAYPDHFEFITHEQFEETMKINLFGIWNTIAAALPHMKKKGGVIVNTSSVVGYIGVFGYTDYAASKFGILGLSEALRSEFKRYNIGVSILCPPDTRTPGFEVENQTKPEETKAISESGGILESEQVARQLIKGIARGKKMIIPGFDAKLSYYLKRWCPGLVEFVMDRTILKTQNRMK